MKDHFERLRRDERYRTLKPLARLQARLGEEHFSKISRFLRSPKWEATMVPNAAPERSGIYKLPTTSSGSPSP